MESKVSNSREARRRKIVDRGSDRLALITGRIQNLPPSEELSSPISSPPSISPAPQNLQSQPFPNQTTVSPYGDSGVSSSVPPKQDSGIESTGIDSYNNATRTELIKGTSETSFEGLTSRPHEVLNKIQPSFLSSTFQELPISHADRGQSSEQSSQPTSTFTMKIVSSAITSLEQTRIVCSVTIAFLALLSYLGFPLLGSTFMKNTIFYKPLYLVLLTNLTMVLAKLLQKKGNLEKGSSGPSRNVRSEEGYDWTQQLGDVMEGGLMLHKVIDAVFMDCSIYAVIIICGLTFAQQLGW